MSKFKAQFNKRPVRDGHFPCDDMLPGDGVDPRYDRSESRRVPNRKALQLCAQVMEVLNLSLGSISSVFLQVVSVVPAPDSTQLLVTLARRDDTPDQVVLEKVQGMYGWIRSEVAQGITRKRVPNLKFIVEKRDG